MNRTYQIEFTDYRCHFCGSFWAFETARASSAYTCPRCNTKRIRELLDITERQQRAINSLRGILNKRKK